MSSFRILSTDCFCRSWWGWEMSRKWRTRSACAIYSRVLLKASTISTGKLVMKPIVSSRVTLVPEASTTLSLCNFTVLRWWREFGKVDLCFWLPPSSWGSSWRLIFRHLCIPPRPPLAYCCFCAWSSTELFSADVFPPRFPFLYALTCPEVAFSPSTAGTILRRSLFGQLCAAEPKLPPSALPASASDRRRKGWGWRSRWLHRGRGGFWGSWESWVRSAIATAWLWLHQQEIHRWAKICRIMLKRSKMRIFLKPSLSLLALSSDWSSVSNSVSL